MSESPPSKPGYESPDIDRPASAAPTETQIEEQTPAGSRSHGHDPYAALRNRGYVIFIVGFFISVIGMQMQVMAARYDVYQKTKAESSLAWLGASVAIPMLLLTLPAGQLADLLSRRRMMIVTQFLAAICMFALAWLARYYPESPHYVAGIFLLLAMGSAAATLGRPARAALMPQLVSAEVFPNAVAWNASLFETASVIGPAIGGLILVKSLTLVYAISAGCMAACGVLIWLLPEPPRSESRGERIRLTDLAVGIRFVWRSKLMLGAMTLDLFAVLFGGAIYLLPVYADKILHVSAAGFGILQAAPSIGAISMAMIQAHRRPMRHAGLALLYAVAGFGICWIIFGISRNFWLSFAMLVLTGALDNISVVIRHTLVQLLTPDAMRGRVSAVNQIFIGSSNELGGTESGLAATWFGTVRSVVYGGVITLLVVVSSAFVFPQIRKLRSLTSIEPETDKVGIVD